MVGRTKIYTDVAYIDETNVADVLSKTLGVHNNNAARIDYLLSFESGNQPLQRVKNTRKDIDIVCIDNVAAEITEFKRGFHFGNPITFIQNGAVTDKTDSIAELNQQYEADEIHSKTSEIGRFVEICGIGYEYVDMNTEYEDGDSFFITTPLDPREAYCVYSSYYTDRRKMCAVMRKKTSDGTSKYTVITRDKRFELDGSYQPLAGNGEPNPFGVINVVEWLRDSDRSGCFERQIADMNTLNILESDYANDVEQNTQAIWHGNDVEFELDENGYPIKPKSGEWVMTFSTEKGKAPTITPLTIEYAYDGMLNNILSKRSLILQKAGVPQRNDNSGGSTGIAMSDATGWSTAEMIASKQQPLIEKAKKEEVKIILAILKESADVEMSNVMRDLVLSDLKPNIKRLKTYELTTKINAIATGLSHGINGEVLFNDIPLFGDPNEAWVRSKEGVEKYQTSVFGNENEAQGGIGETAVNADRLTQDVSDQIDNSPMVDTTKTSK